MTTNVQLEGFSFEEGSVIIQHVAPRLQEELKGNSWNISTNPHCEIGLPPGAPPSGRVRVWLLGKDIEARDRQFKAVESLFSASVASLKAAGISKKLIIDSRQLDKQVLLC